MVVFRDENLGAEVDGGNVKNSHEAEGEIEEIQNDQCQSIYKSVSNTSRCCVIFRVPHCVTRDQNEQDSQTQEKQAAEQVGHGVKAMQEKQKDVEQGLSWRVALLPYLGYQNLYNEFHHDEPWSSPHNRSLIPKMPNVYRSYPDLPEGKTTYLAPVSDRSVVTQESGGINIANIPDGASNTILFVNADRDRAVTWTRPKDLQFDSEHPLKGLGDRGYFTAVFVDGSVHQIPATIDEQTMRRLVWRNDGEPVSLAEIR